MLSLLSCRQDFSVFCRGLWHEVTSFSLLFVPFSVSCFNSEELIGGCHQTQKRKIKVLWNTLFWTLTDQRKTTIVDRQTWSQCTWRHRQSCCVLNAIFGSSHWCSILRFPEWVLALNDTTFCCSAKSLGLVVVKDCARWKQLLSPLEYFHVCHTTDVVSLSGLRHFHDGWCVLDCRLWAFTFLLENWTLDSLAKASGGKFNFVPKCECSATSMLTSALDNTGIQNDLGAEQLSACVLRWVCCFLLLELFQLQQDRASSVYQPRPIFLDLPKRLFKENLWRITLFWCRLSWYQTFKGVSQSVKFSVKYSFGDFKKAGHIDQCGIWRKHFSIDLFIGKWKMMEISFNMWWIFDKNLTAKENAIRSRKLK